MEKQTDNRWWLASIVGEIGFLIAIPLVLFAIVGRAVDAIFGSFPLFFLIGILCAIICSSYIVYRRTSALRKEIEDSDKTATEKSPKTFQNGEIGADSTPEE